jgi:hypothetical protein
MNYIQLSEGKRLRAPSSHAGSPLYRGWKVRARQRACLSPVQKVSDFLRSNRDMSRTTKARPSMAVLSRPGPEVVS